MNNTFKKVIGMGIALNVITTIIPTVLPIGTTAVYAATRDYLKDITVENNKDNDVTLYTKSSCSSSSKLSKLDDDDDIPTSLYGEVSDNIKKVRISDIDLTDSKYDYKIYKGSSEIDLDEEVSISSSVTFKVKVYEGSTLKETYSIRIEKDDDDDDDDDDDVDDDIYLDDITLLYNWDEISFNFKQKTNEYDINVPNEVNFLRIEAEPEDDDDTVRLNDEKLNDEDDWQTKVSLKEGQNKVIIKVRDEDYDNERTYTLNINRKSANGTVNTNTNSNTNSSTNTNTNTNTSNNNAKKNGWAYENSHWVYYDINGNLLKNSWYTNYTTGKSYYLGADGVMVTGWIKLGDYNYYLTPVSGEKLTGWVYLSGKWYHLDARGALIN